MTHVDIFGNQGDGLLLGDILNLISQQYPQFIPILSREGVLDILIQAVSDPEGTINWPRERVEAAIRNTPYYKQTPVDKRNWDILVLQDPATASQRFQKAKQLVDDAMRTQGILLPSGEGWDMFNSPHWRMVEDAAMNNWGQQDIQYQVAQRGGFAQYGGMETQNAAQAKKLADDYGVPLSDLAASVWGKQITKGFDMKALAGAFAQQAKSLYPGLTAMLDRGITVRQIADPYLQIAQQELGVDPTTVSLTDPKWNRAIHTIDTKTGSPTSMSLSEWTKTLRTDTIYGYDRTPHGRAAGADLATRLTQMMGAVG
jgi:hypothetical protein